MVATIQKNNSLRTKIFKGVCMVAQRKSAISPKRAESYADWYQEVVKESDLAEHSPVRGCMVIKPWGYSIWENIQRVLNKMFKATGHQNAYFPLFVPLEFFEKEAKHVEGFAKECAVVTHHRLEKGADGKLHPAGELEQPLIVRPTSEMIIGAMFSKWVQSYRDLPLLINQWANIVRWEMRTRLFLRTAEFLWQEGHTVHASKEEAEIEVAKMLNIYSDFCLQYLAMPVIKGEKSESERFPGAAATFAIEAMMQDKRALQAGTSHFLGQNFAKASDIKFRDESGAECYAWTTSWGMTTRLIGGVVMTHSDDDGLVLPPRIAPMQVVILPVIHNEENKSTVLEYCQKLVQELSTLIYDGQVLNVMVDTRDLRGGEKKWSWVKKGVPLLLEIGPRDIAQDAFSVIRRDKLDEKTNSMKRATFLSDVIRLLEEMQNDLLQKALHFRDQNTVKIDNKGDFYKFFTPQNQEKPEIHGGFAYSHFCHNRQEEEALKENLGVTVRCIPLDGIDEEGKCIICGQKTYKRVIFAKAY